jgi:hypothetical protein
MKQLFSSLYTLIINEDIDDARIGREDLPDVTIKNFRGTKGIDQYIADNSCTYLIIKSAGQTVKINLDDLCGDIEVHNKELRLFTAYELNKKKKYVRVKLNKQPC